MNGVAHHAPRPTRGNPVDMSGRRIGRLVVVERVGTTADRSLQWRCRCDCGQETVVCARSLRKSHPTESCGCLRREQSSQQNRTHGMSHKVPEYEIWMGMKQRCENPNTDFFYRYGGRGIAVCARWRDDFAAFLADVGSRPTAQHSIDRIDGDGDYEPSNVRWATAREQRINRSVSIRFRTLDGELICLSELARELAIPRPNDLKLLFIKSGVLS